MRTSRSELVRLLASVTLPAAVVPLAAPGPVLVPVDLDTLVRSMEDAAATYLERWRARLGVEPLPGVQKEHWARIKALTRRLAGRMSDEYGDLRPVAELQTAIPEAAIPEAVYEAVSEALGLPIDDTSSLPPELEWQVNSFAAAVSDGLHEISRRRIWTERIVVWGKAYAPTGPGSTRVRSTVVDREVLTVAVSGREPLTRGVAAVLKEAAKNAGIPVTG